MVNKKKFRNSKKNLDRALKTIVLDVSWNGLGLFSIQQVFWHLVLIVSSMHPDAILFWQISSTNFIGDFFYELFFSKKYFFMVILRVTLKVNKIFFGNSKKKISSGLKKHCSLCFLKPLGSFFIQASIFTHRFHSQ